MKPLLTALMLGNAALFVFGALQHAGVAIGSPRKFWPPYRVTVGSRPAYDGFAVGPCERVGVEKEQDRLASLPCFWPLYDVFVTAALSKTPYVGQMASLWCFVDR